MASVVDKIILVIPALLIRKTCMIPGCRDPVTDQFSADFLHQFSGKTVDNAAVIRVFHYVIMYFFIFIFRGFHCKVKILSVKSCCCAKRISKVQKSCNVFPHFFRRCGCKCTDHRPLRKLCHKLCDLKVTWPEILSPLGYTMRLIHRDHRNIRTERKIQKRLGSKPLRCHIDDRITSCFCVAQSCEILSLRQGAVKISRRDSRLVQASHLIFHQRDQRGYYQCDPFHHQCRYLIANGFSCSCRHHG